MARLVSMQGDPALGIARLSGAGYAAGQCECGLDNYMWPASAVLPVTPVRGRGLVWPASAVDSHEPNLC